MPLIPYAAVNQDAAPSKTLPVIGYTGWWDMSQTQSLIAYQGQLSIWFDLSGSRNHLTQYAFGPVYGARTINGVLVGDYQGTLSHSLVSNSPRGDRTSCTFVVAEVDTVAAGIRNMIGSDGTDGLEFRLSGADLETVTHSTLLANLASVASASTPFVAVQNVTATNITQNFNTTAETDANSTALTATRRMEVGRDEVNGQPWDGAIAEIVYYPNTLSAGDVSTMVSFLKTKWGIA